jgi:HlyD family secretion protein
MPARETVRTATTLPLWRRGWAWLCLGLLIAGGALAWRWQNPPPPTPPAMAAEPAALPVLTVAVAIAITRPAIAEVVGDGSVVAWQELVISAEVGGLRVVEVPVEEGQAVRAGDLLARLDASVIGAQAAQAEAAVAEAEAARDIARADLGRADQLARSQAGSVQLAEQRRSAALQTEARLASARARRDEVVARVAQTRILAPADGILARNVTRIGNVTAMGQEMFRILRDGRLELDARVPELDLAAVQPGQPAMVRHGGRSIAAEVRGIAPLVAADTRLGTVHLALPAGSGLRPGMFARAEIATGTRQVVVVPAAAVVFRDGAPQVFVLAEGSARGTARGTERVAMRRIAAGAREGGVVEVGQGIAAGERVVVAGAGFLSDGDLVRVAPQRTEPRGP